MILSSLYVQYKIYPQIGHQQYFIKNSFLKPYLQQRLLRIPGGWGSVEEEEEVEGQVQVQVEDPHHHQSRLSPISEKKILSTLVAVCRVRRKQMFGDRSSWSLSSLQSCHFVNYWVIVNKGLKLLIPGISSCHLKTILIDYTNDIFREEMGTKTQC